jgi:hypothetical protein
MVFYYPLLFTEECFAKCVFSGERVMAGPSTYQQTTGNQQTNSSTPVPIPGLFFKLPAGVGTSAIIILNVPNPYAEGNNFPGGWFGISINGTMNPVYASFTYGVQQPVSFNRMPTTLVVGIPLTGDNHPGDVVRNPGQHRDPRQPGHHDGVHRHRRLTGRPSGRQLSGATPPLSRAPSFPSWQGITRIEVQRDASPGEFAAKRGKLCR